MQNNYYKISVFIEEEENVYYAYCPELVGCYSQGDSHQEAQENIKEAVDLYLETFTEHEVAECLEKTVSEEVLASGFDIQPRLTASQTEKLLLGAGFALVGSKDNYGIYLKESIRFVLPLHTGKILSQKMVKEALKLVEKR